MTAAVLNLPQSQRMQARLKLLRFEVGVRHLLKKLDTVMVCKYM